jgi:hypothetical protein
MQGISAIWSEGLKKLRKVDDRAKRDGHKLAGEIAPVAFMKVTNLR